MSAPDRVDDRLRAALHECAASVRIGLDDGDRFARMLVHNHRRTRRNLLAAGAAAVLLVAIALTALLPGIAFRAQPPAHQQKWGLGTVVGSAFLLHDDTSVFAVAGQSIWVANGQGSWDGVLQQLDATTLQKIRSTPLPNVGIYPTGIAADATSVWVTTSDGAIRRVDARTGQLNLTLANSGDEPGGVAIADGSVWVTSTTTSRVSRLDPSSGKILAKVAVGPPSASATRPILATKNGLWVSNGDGSVSRIDPSTNLEVLRTPLPRCCATAMAVDPIGRVWVTLSGGGTVVEIDDVSGRVLAAVPVDANPTGIAVYSDALWVSCRGYEPGATGKSDATLVRIDYRTGAITATVPLPGSVGWLVATGSQLVVSDPTSSKLLIVRASR